MANEFSKLLFNPVSLCLVLLQSGKFGQFLIVDINQVTCREESLLIGKHLIDSVEDFDERAARRSTKLCDIGHHRFDVFVLGNQIFQDRVELLRLLVFLLFLVIIIFLLILFVLG